MADTGTSGHRSWTLEESLRLRIAANLAGFSVLGHQRKNTRRAAVALTLVDAGSEKPVYNCESTPDGEAALILTRRAESLNSHAGQWALPGGGLEGDESPEAAALRELSEEVGLVLDNAAVLGRLDDFTTRSGFTITPVVLWAGADPLLIPNPAEVDSIHRIPLQEFMREDAPVLQSIPESDEPVLLMPVGQGWIASPTGAIIYQFREVALLGKTVRVDHFEQPYFAWQ